MTNVVDITNIIQLILGLVITVASVLVFPKIDNWIGSRLTASQIDIIKIVIKSAVEAAEQIYSKISKSGASKKEYVLTFAKDKLSELGYTFNEKEIEIYLEQAVLELKNKKA